MGLAGRLLVSGCLCYQAAMLGMIVLVFVYFGLIGPDSFLANIESNYELLITIAVPTTTSGGFMFILCHYIDGKY